MRLSVFLQTLYGKARQRMKRHILSMGSCMEAGLAFVSLVMVFVAGSTATGMGKVFSTYLLKDE